MTREEAIERIENHLAYTRQYEMSKTKEAMYMAISALREQDVTDINVGNKWIRVEERLPENIANKVLVCCKNGYVGLGHYEVWRGNQIWYNLESNLPFTDWDLEDCETYEVTHWMPLPKPPKEEV